MADSGSKTEKATPKKRKDERKKGHIFSSKDITTVVSILVVFASLKIMFPIIYEQITKYLLDTIDKMGTIEQITPTVLNNVAFDGVLVFCLTAMPLLLISIFAAVVATGAQTKFLFSADSLKPKLNRLNPLSGLKKMFSLRSLVEIVKSSLKFIIVGAVAVKYIEGRLLELARTPFMDLVQSVGYILDSIIGLVFYLCIVFVFIAAFDYLYQWWDYERQMKMSKHEIKEEYKQMEGDPKVKGKIKEAQRKFAMSRMMQAVPTADVIIKNPTHFAVALRYDIDKDNAPIVVAKGQDNVAFRIIEIGETNHIFITENKPLARALYSTAEINQEIPLEYYSAVAEVLALLYKLKTN